MDRIFNEGDTVKSHLDNKIYIITEVWGDLLTCVDDNGKNRKLWDFEVDLLKERK